MLLPMKNIELNKMDVLIYKAIETWPQLNDMKVV